MGNSEEEFAVCGETGLTNRVFMKARFPRST